MENKNGKEKSSRLRMVLTLALIAAVSIAGFCIWYFDFRPFVSTEDARIDADIVRVANLGAPGQIEKIYIKEGDTVTNGEILLELDRSVAEAQLEKAEARSEFTWAVFQRDKTLLEEEGLTRQQYESARYDNETADGDLKLAEIALTRTYLRSPADGVIILKNAVVGNVLETSQTAFQIADIRHAWVSANISEKSVALLKSGQKVDVNIDEFGGARFRGRIRSIGNAANSIFSLLPVSSGTTFTKVVQLVQVKIDFDDSSIDPIPGENVTVKIRVR
jgi:RND family efflux transporter MFP subunit